jgi:hypothetical protein
MFMQVITGTVADPEGLRRRFDRWASELRGGAAGWLGSTDGVTDEGRFVACVRFESAEAARVNSERPEQGAWWADTEKTLAGPTNFHDCNTVDVYLGGGADTAGFVQVLQGGPADRDRLREIEQGFEGIARQYRPDIMGWVMAWHPDGRFTEVVYFTSEGEAREGETKEPPEDRKHLLDDWRRVAGQLIFFDLRHPWLRS